MTSVYVAVFKAFGNVEDTTPVHAFLLGVFSDPDKAVAAFESIFDDDPQFYIGVGMAEFIEITVEIEKTVWAVERSVHRATIDEAHRPLTKAEQERDVEALAEEYGRAVAEYESEAHE